MKLQVVRALADTRHLSFAWAVAALAGLSAAQNPNPAQTPSASAAANQAGHVTIEAGGARGAIMAFYRSHTSNQLLQIDWTYPKVLEVEAQTEGTRAAPQMVALPLPEALVRLRGEDPRPLLLMRACAGCEDGSDEDLAQSLGSERARLLTRWFRCVWLPEDVLEPNHAYHSLFAGENPPHLLLCSATDDELIPLDGQAKRPNAVREMEKILKRDYRKSASSAVKGILRLLDEYDQIEAEELRLREQIEVEIESRGKKTSKGKRLQAKLDKLLEQKAKAEKEEDELFDLGLKPRK